MVIDNYMLPKNLEIFKDDIRRLLNPAPEPKYKAILEDIDKKLERLGIPGGHKKLLKDAIIEFIINYNLKDACILAERIRDKEKINEISEIILKNLSNKDPFGGLSHTIGYFADREAYECALEVLNKIGDIYEAISLLKSAKKIEKAKELEELLNDKIKYSKYLENKILELVERGLIGYAFIRLEELIELKPDTDKIVNLYQTIKKKFLKRINETKDEDQISEFHYKFSSYVIHLSMAMSAFIRPRNYSVEVDLLEDALEYVYQAYIRGYDEKEIKRAVKDIVIRLNEIEKSSNLSKEIDVRLSKPEYIRLFRLAISF